MMSGMFALWDPTTMLKVGVASYEEMKARAMAVARVLLSNLAGFHSIRVDSQ